MTTSLWRTTRLGIEGDKRPIWRTTSGHTVRVRGTVNHEKNARAKEKAKDKTQDNPKRARPPDGDGREDGQPQLQQVTATLSQSK